MGAVYEAEHTVLGQRAAVKLLTSDFIAQPNLVQRFYNEARLASQINHPGIVRVYDVGQIEGGPPWLAMEFLEGQSLAERMHMARKLPGRCLGVQDFWIVGETASALGAAHAKGIVHRDLKPANIMTISDPATLTGERVKVLDFGIAKLMHGDAMTKPGAVLGTPHYMALEQFKDSAQVSDRADVFSLGVIAYQILTGRLPHGGNAHYEIMGARLLDPIPPLQQVAPSVPPDMAALVMRMLEREPGPRPTMVEVETEVRQLLGLPAPRQSGWHNAVAAMGPTPTPTEDGPKPAEQNPYDLDSNAPTPDAPPNDGAKPAIPPTPSSEKAAWEVSPRSMAVPESLSSMPSIPVAAAALALRAGPDDRTAPPEPTPIAPAERAATTAPSLPEQPRRRSIYLVSAVGVLLVIGGTATMLMRDSSKTRGNAQPSTPTAPAPLPPSTPPSTNNQPAPVATPPPVAPPPTEPLSNLPVEKANPEKPTTSTTAESAPRRRGGPKSNSASRSSPRCQPVAFAESCVTGRNLSASVKSNVVRALRDSGVRMCAGERMIFGPGSGGFRVIEAPDRVSTAVRQDFQLTLGGTLDIQSRLGEIQVRCGEEP